MLKSSWLERWKYSKLKLHEELFSCTLTSHLVDTLFRGKNIELIFTLNCYCGMLWKFCFECTFLFACILNQSLKICVDMETIFGFETRILKVFGVCCGAQQLLLPNANKVRYSSFEKQPHMHVL